LKGKAIHFNKVFLDRTFPKENATTRKPGTGMLTEYLNNSNYDIANSFVIGDRITDVQLAKNLGCKAIWLNLDTTLGGAEVQDKVNDLRQSTVVLETAKWSDIYSFLKLGLRTVSHDRNTNETKIHIELNLDGSGKTDIQTGLGFFDHMLDQIARHGKMDLTVIAKGDLHIDEHHTIEDVGIALEKRLEKAWQINVGWSAMALRCQWMKPMRKC
jgi:imidazoleglycerol-phosphate dehydratase/histidinol-phosphatase